jgi:hypothetical protein
MSAKDSPELTQREGEVAPVLGRLLLSQPPNLDDLRAQRDAGRFTGGGPNAGGAAGCGGCSLMAFSITASVLTIVSWLLL